MSPILIALVCLYPLLGGSGLIAFVQAARRTSEDWEQCPAARQIDLDLLRAEDQTESKPRRGVASRARQA
jgi:hypothetical protein